MINQDSILIYNNIIHGDFTIKHKITSTKIGSMVLQLSLNFLFNLNGYYMQLGKVVYQLVITDLLIDNLFFKIIISQDFYYMNIVIQLCLNKILLIMIIKTKNI